MGPLDPTRWIQRLYPATPEQRAMVLLLRRLTPEQQHQLLRFNYFDMVAITPAGVRAELRIHNVHHGFVEWPERKVVYCVYAWPRPSQVPPADETLAKKMALEGNPDYFYRTANEMPTDGCLVHHRNLFATSGYVDAALAEMAQNPF